MTTSGWAIKYTYTNADGAVRTGLIHRLYFGRVPPALCGYQVAVFPTRQLAREAARVAGRGYDRATAVRVRVTVEEPATVSRAKLWGAKR